MSNLTVETLLEVLENVEIYSSEFTRTVKVQDGKVYDVSCNKVIDLAPSRNTVKQLMNNLSGIY